MKERKSEQSEPSQLDSAGEAATHISALRRAQLFAVLIAALIFLAPGWMQVNPAFSGDLLDPDSYMRLERARQIYESGEWHNSHTVRISPPEGHTQHWTRILDGLLLFPALLGAPFFGFERSLYWSAVFLPSLAFFALIPLFVWAFRPLFSPEDLWLLPVLLVFQPLTVLWFSPGLFDNPFLSALCFVAFVGFLFRMAQDSAESRAKRGAWGAGLMAGLALWHTLESAIFFGIGLGWAAMLWIVRGQPRAEILFRFALSCFLFSGLALWIERPIGDFLIVEADRLSGAHVLLLGVHAVLWLLLSRLEERRFNPVSERRLLRAGTMAGCALVGVGLTYAVGLIGNPIGMMDPYYEETRFRFIAEYQPAIDLSEGFKLKSFSAAFYILAAPAAGFAGMFLFRGGPGASSALLMIALWCAFFAFTLKQGHWAFYLQLIAVPGLARLCGATLKALEGRFSAGKTLLRPLVLALFVASPYVSMARGSAGERPDAPFPGLACVNRPLLTFLADRRAFPESMNLLALVDFGPKLLYRTHHRVFSIPNHRPQRGYRTGYRILAQSSPDEAEELLAGSNIDLVLICPGSSLERWFYSIQGHPDSLYEQLIGNAIPPYLAEIETPAETGARLFRVVAR